MRKAKFSTDPLTPARRLRVEALRLAIAMEPGRYPDVASYLPDAEEIERWVIEADGGPPPATEHDFYAAIDFGDGE